MLQEGLYRKVANPKRRIATSIAKSAKSANNIEDRQWKTKPGYILSYALLVMPAAYPEHNRIIYVQYSKMHCYSA